MIFPRKVHQAPASLHRAGCICPECRAQAAPRPSDPRPAFLAGLTPRSVAAQFLAGMLFGAVIVAATGNLGAALRALVGL